MRFLWRCLQFFHIISQKNGLLGEARAEDAQNVYGESVPLFIANAPEYRSEDRGPSYFGNNGKEDKGH